MTTRLAALALVLFLAVLAVHAAAQAPAAQAIMQKQRQLHQALKPWPAD